MESIDKPVTFEALRVHYYTGRSYLIRSEYRHKVYGLRQGMMTDLGDLDPDEWKRLAQQLIQDSGEEQLQANLMQWTSQHTPWLRKKQEFEQHVLELHMERVFDNPLWVDYVPFNRQYRPEVLETTRLVWILTECCQTPAQVTLERFEVAKSRDNTLSCPFCGRLSQFRRCTSEEVSMNG